MAIWTFRCYDDGQGPPNLWERWYNAHPEIQGTHDAKLRILEQQPIWNDPHYTDNMPGDVVEIRIKGRVQWRIFGHYGQKRYEFVVTAIGWHKGRQYNPRGVVATAGLLKLKIESGKSNAPICKRPS